MTGESRIFSIYPDCHIPAIRHITTVARSAQIQTLSGLNVQRQLCEYALALRRKGASDGGTSRTGSKLRQKPVAVEASDKTLSISSKK
ncbi:MAG TPA: hypothetical protein DGH25_11440 [Erwiniaceae bacterium]|uniref:Uncharacterized protein n=2 Tax=Mixta calida TaxID=665913 RepID=A0ABN5H6T3_9GAMM|nr:hypothetical protein [Mixta calida]AIX74993.1 hypothetical protein PSNIH2_15195 [Pantoea sp. PSNIH2]POU49096.1 hypothetical protein C3380_10190 [Pantoea sp. PSNIH5]POU70268.1 hypothetical protein C3374_00580 [Pantoea sp. PSNIH4]POY67788.1 hypothetical protein C3402_11010 [Pantoea sp. PSNIH3]HCW47965.1 hypothetical protein [Erwiniaceae bacterium]